MIILGIDPGSRRMGYGIIDHTGAVDRFVAAGVLGIDRSEQLESLKIIKEGIEALIKKYKPELIAIEKLFFSKNQKTAMQVAEARGVAVAASLATNIPIAEFSPNEIKMNIAGYGHADKKAVAKMVRLILREPQLRIIDDASDALAAALAAARLVRK